MGLAPALGTNISEWQLLHASQRVWVRCGEARVRHLRRILHDDIHVELDQVLALTLIAGHRVIGSILNATRSDRKSSNGSPGAVDMAVALGPMRDAALRAVDGLREPRPRTRRRDRRDADRRLPRLFRLVRRARDTQPQCRPSSRAHRRFSVSSRRPLLGRDGRSLFNDHGYVPGSQRAERWLLWPMGIAHPGTMRQWGLQATAFVGRRHFDEPDLFENQFFRNPAPPQ